jgi:1-hydroxycarotenoid 3,4-desaturase
MADARVVVIGAGMGGLVSALELAQRGLAVTVVEAGLAPGGKMRSVLVDGAPVDSGPTVFTMKWVFDQILADVGTRLEREVALDPLPVIARHFWDPRGSDAPAQLDLHADPRASVDAVAQFAGPAEAQRFQAFCALAREVYDTLEGPFIRSTSPTLLRMVGDLGVRGLGVLARLGPMRSLWDSLGQQFADERMRQLFARYATYCGSSPWHAPATLMLIAQVEMDGVWSVRGGMHALARMFERLARERGVQFRYGQTCERIDVRDGRACGVTLRGGERLDAQAVVFNGDVAALSTGLLGHAVQQAAARRGAAAPGRSLSALTWSLNCAAQAEPAGALDRHNVFFQHGYRSEFDDIFGARRLPSRPTVYVCAQDRGAFAAGGAAGVARADAPDAAAVTSAPQAQRLLCLVNAPAVGDRTDAAGAELISEEALARCEHESFSLLRRCGLDLQPQAGQSVRTGPAEFHRLFPATGGALYGQASHGWMSAFSRSPAKSRLPGLFLAGGSVHPGPGVPMAAMSGHLAAAAVMGHLASTSRSRVAATSGGMSTRSATTDGSA